VHRSSQLIAKSRAKAAWLAFLALLGACTVGPDYRPPTVTVATGLATPPRLLETQPDAFTSDPLPGAWWRLYDAPDLDALVQKALVRNTDLQTALASLEAAQASLRATELERTPVTGLGVGATYGQASADALGAPQAFNPGPVYALMEATSYDFDLFGRIKRGIEASRGNVEAAHAALDLARVNVVASVAGAYATVCSTGHEIAVTNRSIALAQDIESVTERRFHGGIAGANDVVRARALLIQTQAELPNLIARQHAGLYLLATLTGDPPEAFPRSVAVCDAPPVIRSPIPVGDGMSLLKRRPDVRQAERRLAASVAEIGVATSALYPTVTLGGQIGTDATSAGDIVRSRAFSWNVGPMVSWNFPNLAIAKAGISQANAVARGNLASFDSTVLTALRETDTALTALARQAETERALRDARVQAALAARNTERLYAGGVGAFIDTLDAERTEIDADAALADATSQLADRQVQLFLVLGGGWQDAPPPLETPLDDVTRAHPLLSRTSAPLP
jgi:outer membrane protein, multidrug efflux system